MSKDGQGIEFEGLLADGAQCTFVIRREPPALWRGDGIVPLERRALDLLWYLIDKAPNVALRGDILYEVWGPDSTVQGENIDAQIRTIRKTIGAKCIKTVHKSGYRFEASARQVQDINDEPPIPSVPHTFGLPARNCSFTGRKSLLDQLRNLLTAGSAAALTSTRQVAAHGLGGIGKSQLAIEYAWYWASDYSRIIWLQAESPQTLGRDFDALAVHLRLFAGGKPVEQTTVIKAVRDYLQHHPGWLLIFDNAPEPKAVEHAVPAVGGHIIFTSRYFAWAKHATPLRVDTWTPEEAEQFLFQFEGICGEHDATERDAAVQLSRELGYLPLALQHVAAYCERSGLTLADYLPLFQRKRLELFDPENLSEGQDPNDTITVATTWNLSLDRIRENERCPEAGAFLDLCAFFGSDRIPFKIILEGTDYLPQALSAGLRNDLKANAIVGALLRYSLVTIEGRGEERVLSIHRLLQEVNRKRLADGKKIRWITAALQMINHAFPANSGDVRQWPTSGRLAPHAIAVLHYAEPLEIEQEVTAKVLNQLAVYARSRAEFSTAEPLFQRALAIRERALGPDHPDTAGSLSGLAFLYQIQGRYNEAEPLFQRALAIRERALGPDHPDTAQGFHGLALLFDNQGRYDEAEPLCKRALAIREKALGPDHPDTASSLNTLTHLYRDQGRYDEAEPLSKCALAIREKALGPDHPDTAGSLNNLAGLYRVQGRYDEAEPLFQRALAIKEKELGSEHPSTAQSLNNLALLYSNQGRHDEAEPLFRRALDIREIKLGPEHPHTAQSLNSLALLYDNQGRHDKAEPLYRRARNAKERVLGRERGAQ